MKKLLTTLSLICLAIIALAQGSSALDQLKADPRKAYGTDYPYSFSTVSLTKAPSGYQPFYISHYARHGSRYYWSPYLYNELDSLLTTANSKHQLTTEGEAFYKKFMAVKEELKTDEVVSRQRGTWVRAVGSVGNIGLHRKLIGIA